MGEESVLPEGFRFGVATAGFQIEGGLNGPAEPANNWAAWERRGRIEPSGIALDFWNRYEEQLDRTRDMGCDTFRLSVEWTRCEPDEAQVDTDAFGRYAAILDACHEGGLHPVVTLHHFTHPAWLGEDFWLRGDLAAVLAAIDDGIPITGYWHWTLADNYEWGTYERRFGLFGVDRGRGVRWSDRDSMGDDSAGAYRRIIAGLRHGDRSVLV